MTRAEWVVGLVLLLIGGDLAFGFGGWALAGAVGAFTNHLVRKPNAG